MRQLLTLAVRFFDYTPKEDESARYRLTRAAVMEWACDLGFEECTTPAKDDFDSWISNVDRYRDRWGFRLIDSRRMVVLDVPVKQAPMFSQTLA